MRYEKYKDSGIEWIGEIPEHWEVVKLKHYANLYGRIGWQGLTSDEYQEEGPYLITGIDFEDGGINWERCHHITEERWREADKVQINNGDLLITKDGTVGKIAIVDGLNGKASLNSGVMLIDLKQVNKKFMFYLLASEVFWKWFNYVNLGQTTIKHLYQNVFKEFSFPQPNKNEQDEIASYLDEKTAKIDSIIKSLEKQKDKLEEYKRELITETVTKGLDKNVPMKDSGVDWLGEIPEYWEVKPLKSLFDFGKGLPITKKDLVDSGVSVVSYGQIHAKWNSGTHLHNELIKFVSHDYLPAYSESLVNKGDFIMADTSEDLDGCGNCAYVDVDDTIFAGYHTIILKTKRNRDNKYFAYLFLSDPWRSQIRKRVTGVKVFSISKKILGNTSLLVPPKCQQEEIVSYLDNKTDLIEKTKEKIELQIEKLKEYRKIIIHDAVTGKIKVGGGED